MQTTEKKHIPPTINNTGYSDFTINFTFSNFKLPIEQFQNSLPYDSMFSTHVILICRLFSFKTV